jgi:hypothetical protein
MTSRIVKAINPFNRRAGKAVLALIAVFPISGAQAGDGDIRKGGYDKIAQRNVFGLVSSSIAEVSTSAQTATPAQVKLTGITTVLGEKRAFFIVHGAPDGGKAKDESYMLTVGQRQNGYELLDLDEKAGIARLRADGRLLVLSLASPKLPTAAAPATAAPPQTPVPLTRPFSPRGTAKPAEMPPLPPLPGVPESGSNADSQSEADLAGRP